MNAFMRWRWRGLLLVAMLAGLLWGLQFLVLHLLAGGGVVPFLLAVIGTITAGILYGRWAVRSSGATDPSRNVFIGALEMPLRRIWARRNPHPAQVWFRWGMASKYPDQAFAFLQEAAKLNHAEALFELGLYQASGGLGLGGRASARDLFRRAAELGHSESAFHYAEMIRWGEGATRNSQEAHRWYLHSAKRGFAPAIAWLIPAFENGEGTDRNPEEAARWRNRLAELEVIPGLRTSALQQIQTPEHDSAQRLRNEIRSASEDFFEALATFKAFPWVIALGAFLVLVSGCVFVYAWGVTMLASPIWLPLFAILGICVVGFGVVGLQSRKRMHYGRETRQLDAAADQGSPEACFQVGMDYLRGTHEKPRDPVTAKQWLFRAAEAGHVEAMFELGDLLCWNIAGARDSAGADAWFRRAADAGHVGARARVESKNPLTDAEEEGKA